eukprot:TRINITY_DN2837_c2_g1_i1.p2 TRINITY_DN2837_c2_g1~~TRINITY_DN2837_c2_g1_i1.p2  ORF type:complete len:249 (+),score=110.49 TRINITY_DN2837_c2_g1_i1:110-856(+)
MALPMDDAPHEYFDIDAILAEEERVVIQTSASLYCMGWMKGAGSCLEQEQLGDDDDDDSEEGAAAAASVKPVATIPSAQGDLAAGTVLAVPLWTAAPLLRRQACRVTIPKYFDHGFLGKLRAHPFAVDLSKEATPYYYEFARLLADALPDAGRQYEGSNQRVLKAAALEVFTQRALHVIQASENKGHDGEVIRSRLTELEKQLFAAAAHERTAMRRWAAHDDSHIHTTRYAATYASADLPFYLRFAKQ